MHTQAIHFRLTVRPQRKDAKLTKIAKKLSEKG